MVGNTVEVHSSTISSHANNIGQVKWSGVIMKACLAPNEAANTCDQFCIIEVKGNNLVCSRHQPIQN